MISLVVDNSRVHLSPTIASVLIYAIIGFYGVLPEYLKDELCRPRKICRKLVGKSDVTLIDNEDTYNQNLRINSNRIIKDETHPLNGNMHYFQVGDVIHDV